MKIFVSYSRRDAGDFAKKISESLIEEHNIFTDINNIQVGDIWSNTIENNITTCDIFVVIVTFAALKSPEVEKEVLQAQKQNKKIIPCIYSGININAIKWGLEKIQGIEFNNEYDLARNLYGKISQKSAIKINGNDNSSKIIKNSHIDSLKSGKEALSDSDHKLRIGHGFSLVDVRKIKGVKLKILIPGIAAAVGVVITIIFFGGLIVPLSTHNYPRTAVLNNTGTAPSMIAESDITVTGNGLTWHEGIGGNNHIDSDSVDILITSIVNLTSMQCELERADGSVVEDFVDCSDTSTSGHISYTNLNGDYTFRLKISSADTTVTYDFQVGNIKATNKDPIMIDNATVGSNTQGKDPLLGIDTGFINKGIISTSNTNLTLVKPSIDNTSKDILFGAGSELVDR